MTGFRKSHWAYFTATASLLMFAAQSVQAQAPQISCPFSLATPSLPSSFVASGAIDNQTTADCAAWQQFIYLNWQAVSGQATPDKTVAASQFGILPAGATTVWQSFTPANSLFEPSSPASRNTPPPLVLTATSKFGKVTVSGIDQASGAVWLTSQKQNLTYYDVRMNPNEVEYVSSVQGGGPLNTATNQLACVTAVPAGQTTGGFRLPMGYGNDTDCNGNKATYGDDTGSIELKAAWVILSAGDPNNSRYLTASATVTDPYGVTTTQTVGLTGLHIIRRMPGASQFLWSTFEHVDNTPDYNLTTQQASDPRTATGAPRNARTDYTYFNSACTASTDPYYNCTVNLQPKTPCPTSAGRTAADPTCYPYNAPQQVGRTTPLEFHANGINQWVWSQIPSASIFQFYRLIDVQWPNNPAPQLLSGALGAGINGTPNPTNMVPDLVANNSATRVIANTTMETYVQAGAFPQSGGAGTCMDCHASATISALTASTTAPAATAKVNKPGVRAFASTAGQKAPAAPFPAGDYLASFSFIFLNATVTP